MTNLIFLSCFAPVQGNLRKQFRLIKRLKILNELDETVDERALLSRHQFIEHFFDLLAQSNQFRNCRLFPKTAPKLNKPAMNRICQLRICLHFVDELVHAISHFIVRLVIRKVIRLKQANGTDDRLIRLRRSCP